MKYLPTSKEQRAINHILDELKDYDRLYTEDGDSNEQGQADMAVGRLISPSYDSTCNEPNPRLWNKAELKAIYKLGYRLSKDDNDHTIEESFTKDKLTMLESANAVFNLHDHKQPLTKKEYYRYKAENYRNFFENKWKVKFKRLWYKFLSKVTRQNDTE